ncbi:very long chain fatty acid elongase AAEL008004-like isoform X1 [Linepithema humile]|uniref:very long chain fatty acid elongase AAEL008004-like isoform X1 n=2 Tax=Linepithema humile TaxID=83485 RepID=UPI00351EEAFD
MALLQHLVNNYTEVLQNLKDPMIDTWPLMGSPYPLLCILVTYLIFAIKTGPKIMEQRPAFQLNRTMILYNGFQILFSVWLTALLLDLNIQLFSFHGCNDIHRLPMSQRKYIRTALSRSGLWYFLAKVTELLDTVFMVLRKKQNQLTFLHVYHHTVTVLVSWCYLKLLPGEQGVVVAFLNSVVHIIMYSYYFIAALGSKYKKYIWWKKYMTCIQLLHFGMLCFYLIATLVLDCRMTKALTYFLLIIFFIFIYLFSNFFQKAYKTKTA